MRLAQNSRVLWLAKLKRHWFIISVDNGLHDRVCARWWGLGLPLLLSLLLLHALLLHGLQLLQLLRCQLGYLLRCELDHLRLTRLWVRVGVGVRMVMRVVMVSHGDVFEEKLVFRTRKFSSPIIRSLTCHQT